MKETSIRPNKKLGFGLMRLPVLEDGKIDIPAVCQMVDAFLEKGFTYFDTAYVYHEGTSETAVKEVLVNRHPRGSFTLATKLPAWEMKCREDVQRIFDEQLARTGAGYFDYYLLHAVQKSSISIFDQYDCWSWAQKMKEQGLIRHFGFSFHDTAEMLDELLTKHPEVEFVQLQINYMDWEDEKVQSRKCYEVAVKHGVPVVVMEPVKGGTLASLPEKPEAILKECRPQASLASWGIRFCASLDNVMAILSGMSDQSQMEDNLQTMSDFQPLYGQEMEAVQETVKAIRSVPTISCTACRYCVEGCPQQIKIPDIFKCVNQVRLYGKSEKVTANYKNIVKESGAASACVKCGQCEGVCPQHLTVTEYLEEAVAVFES